MTENCDRINIFVPESESRSRAVLDYVFSQIFCEWYGREINVFSDFSLVSTAHIIYCDDASLCDGRSSALSVYRHGDVDVEIKELGKWNELPVFFENKETGKLFDIPFDIFQAIFWLVSRREEYPSLNKNLTFDKHGRYDFKQSLAYRFGFLDRPLVDEWLVEFVKVFNRKFPEIQLVPLKHPHLLTIDVDNVFAFKNKGIIKTLISLAMAKVKGRESELKLRLDVLFRKKEDPFFNICEVAERLPRESVMFFHCGGYGKNDKKTLFPSLKYWRAKQKIDKILNVGLHPSYRSAHSLSLLKLEKWVLEKCLGRKVTSTRMHYLLFNFPDTARSLMSIGITDDYSLAYSDIPGFRASTARSFKFFDCERNMSTNLTIHPLIVMDKTLRSNLGLTTDQATAYLKDLKAQCERNNVPLTMLFHNQNLTEIDGWQEWNTVFDSVL